MEQSHDLPPEGGPAKLAIRPIDGTSPTKGVGAERGLDDAESGAWLVVDKLHTFLYD